MPLRHPPRSADARRSQGADPRMDSEGSHETARETACLPGRETLSETVQVADHQSYSELEKASDANTRPVTWTRAGVVLLVVSALLWVPLPFVPFLPLSTGAKAAVGSGLVVAAEIAFWAGAALAGPEAVRRMRSWIRTAFRRRV